MRTKPSKTYVHTIAEKGGIERDMIKPQLIGFCTYVADRVATVDMRTRGLSEPKLVCSVPLYPRAPRPRFFFSC